MYLYVIPFLSSSLSHFETWHKLRGFFCKAIVSGLMYIFVFSFAREYTFPLSLYYLLIHPSPLSLTAHTTSRADALSAPARLLQSFPTRPAAFYSIILPFLNLYLYFHLVASFLISLLHICIDTYVFFLHITSSKI